MPDAASEVVASVEVRREAAERLISKEECTLEGEFRLESSTSELSCAPRQHPRGSLLSGKDEVTVSALVAAGIEELSSIPCRCLAKRDPCDCPSRGTRVATEHVVVISIVIIAWIT